MPMNEYRGFLYQIKPIYETPESRLARGNWQLRPKPSGYYFTLWKPHGEGHRKMPQNDDVFDEQWQAEQIAKVSIDAIVDSL